MSKTEKNQLLRSQRWACALINFRVLATYNWIRRMTRQKLVGVGQLQRLQSEGSFSTSFLIWIAYHGRVLVCICSLHCFNSREWRCLGSWLGGSCVSATLVLFVFLHLLRDLAVMFWDCVFFSKIIHRHRSCCNLAELNVHTTVFLFWRLCCSAVLFVLFDLQWGNDARPCTIRLTLCYDLTRAEKATDGKKVWKSRKTIVLKVRPWQGHALGQSEAHRDSNCMIQLRSQ